MADRSLRLSTSRIPISGELQDGSGIGLTASLEPFLEPVFISCNVSPATIGRCRSCGGYLNQYCEFQEFGWVCCLCATLNEFSDGLNSRYLDRRCDPSQYMELASNVVDLHVDDEIGQDNTIRPALLCVVDLTMDEESLGMVCNALLAALEGLSLGCHYLGLVLLDPSGLRIYNWHEEKFACLTIDQEGIVPDVCALLSSAASAFLFLESEGEKERASQAIESIRNFVAEKALHGFSKVFLGESLQALMRFMATAQEVDSLHVDGRLMGSRLSVFLGGMPSRGVGSLSCSDIEKRRSKNDGGFYLDPLYPEMPMRRMELRGQPEDNSENEENREETTYASYDEEVQKFYVGAGAAANLLGVSVDIITLGLIAEGIQILSPLATLSGGRLMTYANSELSATTFLDSDICKLFTRPEFLNCSFRIRTSTEVEVVGSVDSRSQEDPNHSGAFLIPRVHQSDTFSFYLGHRRGAGLTGRRPICVQAAVAYTILVQDQRSTGFKIQRCLRILTKDHNLAYQTKEVYDGFDLDAYFFSQFNAAMAIYFLSGRQEATQSLMQGLVRIIRASKEWMLNGEYVGSALGSESKYKAYARTLGRNGKLVHLTFNLTQALSSQVPALFKVLYFSSCTCDDLRAAICPVLIAWKDKDTVGLPDLAWEEALACNAPYLVLDAYDRIFVFQRDPAFPLESTSRLMQYTNSCRRFRIPTPAVRIIKDLESFENAYHAIQAQREGRQELATDARHKDGIESFRLHVDEVTSI